MTMKKKNEFIEIIILILILFRKSVLILFIFENNKL